MADWEFSWWLLLPGALSVLYGYTESRAKAAIKLPALRVWSSCFVTSLVTASLTVVWAAGGYPLPLLYLLVYLCQSVRLLVGHPVQMKNWFILNISYANTLALHLITIGIAALIRNATMNALLEDPFWRTMSVSAVLLISIVEDISFLRWPNFSALLTAEAESEEARPFMAFLWFCAVYLLVDSTLCVFELEPLYPPLFLIGSSAVVIFTLIRFLLHINALIRNNHLKDEHDRLTSILVASEERTDTLQQLTDRDALTGAFSRRYAMERIDAMIEADSPFSLIFLDLDGLKKINDLEGHGVADVYLIQFSRTLEGRLRDEDMLARVGGDEFIVLIPGCDAQTADGRFRRIRNELEQERQGEPTFRFSYGVTAFPQGKKDAELLIREADLAMYQDKTQRHRGEEPK